MSGERCKREASAKIEFCAFKMKNLASDENNLRDIHEAHID